jgi:hypothetical protein
MILLAEKPNGFYSTRSLDTRDGAALADDSWSTPQQSVWQLSNWHDVYRDGFWNGVSLVVA